MLNAENEQTILYRTNYTFYIVIVDIFFTIIYCNKKSIHRKLIRNSIINDMAKPLEPSLVLPRLEYCKYILNILRQLDHMTNLISCNNLMQV